MGKKDKKAKKKAVLDGATSQEAMKNTLQHDIEPVKQALGLMPFEFEGATIRSIMDGDLPWFNADDVCKALGYLNTPQTLDDHVDDEDISKRYTLCDVSNGYTTSKSKARKTQVMAYVNESGLYALIFGSSKPKAKRFKRWVTSEVLPTIRKTGKYEQPKQVQQTSENVTRCNSDPLALDANLMAKLLQVFDKQYQRAEIAMALARAGALDDYVQLSMRDIEKLTNYSVSVASVHRTLHAFEELGALLVKLEPYSYMLNRQYLELKLSQIQDKENIPPSLLLALDYPKLLS